MRNITTILLILILGVLVIVLVLSSLFKKQTITFEKVEGPLENPLMGWAPWATVQESSQPFTLVYADLTWRELEPQEGVYDIDSFEEQNQFERWRLEGKRVVFRFVLDKPGSEAHLDIPDWLYEKIEGDGDLYDHSYGKGFSPNYANRTLIDYHQKAIDALAAHYANDDFIAYIELGSIGHWGEWHIKRDTTIRNLPPAEIRDQYVLHYTQAFPDTHILMRRPFSIAITEGLGIYNDMTADPDSTDTWLNWIADGGVYTQTGEEDAISAMPDQWQVAPIGGEQTSRLSFSAIYQYSLDQTLELLHESHATFIGPNGPYKEEHDEKVQAGVDRVLASIGYRFFIESVQLPSKVYWGESVDIRLNVRNLGIAPMYYDWPIFIHVFDREGSELFLHPIEYRISTILPGQKHTIVVNLPINQLRDGEYQFGIAIHDPISDQPAVMFANVYEANDRVALLAKFEIDRINEAGR